MNNSVLFIIILLLILIFIYFYCSSPNKKNNYQNIVLTEEKEYIEPKCVCAFDIDHTITCGNPKPFIDKCIERGCKLALNTARPVKYVGDVDLDAMNFSHPHYDSNDFYYNPNSYTQTPVTVGEIKSSYLELLKNKYNIKDKKCVVLLDDADFNIKAAQENGYSTIKANRLNKDHPMCGLVYDDVNKLDDILSIC